MTRAFAVFLLAVSATLLCACDGPASMLPKSGGRPYEVLVVSSDKAVSHLLDSVLSQDGQTRNVIISTSQPVVLADDGKDVI